MALQFLNNGYFAGKVGIGTDNPYNKTHITTFVDGDGLLLDYSGGNDNKYVGVFFKIDNNTSDAYKKGALVWERTGGYNEGRFHFLLNNDDNASNVDLTDSKVTILSTGNVGIGTTSPSSKLQVSTTTNVITPLLTLHNNTATNGSAAGASIDFVASSDATAIGARIISTRVANGAHMDLRFHTQRDQFAMIIDTSRNVGIGTTSPGEPLTVKTKTAAYFPGIKVEDYDSSMGLYVQNIEGSNSGIGTGRYYNSNFWRSDVTAPTTIRLDGGAIRFYAQSGVTADVNYTATERMNIASTGAIKFNTYDSTNNTGTPTYLLGTDGSGNVVKTNTIPGSAAGPYLPLTAGASNKLTSDLYIDSTIRDTNAEIVIKRSSNTIRLGSGSVSDIVTAYSGGQIALTLDSSQNANFAGDVTLTNGKLTVTHDTNNAAKIIQTATSMSNSTYTFEVDSSSHNSNMSAAGAMAVDVNSGRAFTIAGNGNVGIGTTHPNQLLEVANSAGGATISISTDQSPGSQATKKYLNLDFTGYSNNVMARIQSWDESSSTGHGNLTFSTKNASTGLLSQRMIINHTGNVGIGTDSPDSKLDVTGGNITINTTGTTFADFKYGAIGSEISRGSITTDGIDLKVNATADLLLLPTGNVGIGTTSPSEKLDVVGNIELNGVLYIGSRGIYQQENTDVSGLELVANASTSLYRAAFFDYVIQKTGNVRAGTVFACNDGGSVEYTETSTNDIGDTSDVVLSVDILGGNMRLLADAATSGWSVKSLIRAI